MNETEIRTYLHRNDYAALSRVADSLMFFHHFTVEDVFRLFERLGGNRPMLEEAVLGNGGI